MIVMVPIVLGSVQPMSGRRYEGSCIGISVLKAFSRMMAQFALEKADVCCVSATCLICVSRSLRYFFLSLSCV